MKLPILFFLLMVGCMAKGQQAKPDTTRKYHLTETEVLQISQLLSAANDIAAGSDKISANQYNAYVKQIAHVDSVLRVQYLRWNPQPVKEIKSKQ